MGSSTLRYSATNAFETFPFPPNVPERLEDLGHMLHGKRKAAMENKSFGLTEMYNQIHDVNSSVGEDSLSEIRQLHSKIDHLTLEAYGWSDIELKHGFYEVEYLPENDRNRFTIHPNARKEILTRLLKLNHRLHSAEIDKTNISNKRSKNEKGAASGSLFN